MSPPKRGQWRPERWHDHAPPFPQHEHGSVHQSGRPVPTAPVSISAVHTGAKCLRNKPAASGELGDMASDAGDARTVKRCSDAFGGASSTTANRVESVYATQ